MEEKLIRHIIYSDEFEEYYASMNEQLKKKYDYALQIVKSQYVVSSKNSKELREYGLLRTQNFHQLQRIQNYPACS